jgi:hypothetical protein
MSESPADWISAALIMAMALAFVASLSRED